MPAQGAAVLQPGPRPLLAPEPIQVLLLVDDEAVAGVLGLLSVVADCAVERDAVLVGAGGADLESSLGQFLDGDDDGRVGVLAPAQVVALPPVHQADGVIEVARYLGIAGYFVGIFSFGIVGTVYFIEIALVKHLLLYLLLYRGRGRLPEPILFLCCLH